MDFEPVILNFKFFNKTEYFNSLQEMPVNFRKRVNILKNISATLAHILTKTGYSNLLLEKEKIENLKIRKLQLEESELKFRELFEQAGVGVAQIESDTGRFVKVNKKYADMLGYTIEEMMQLTFLDFTHPDDIEESLLYKDELLSKNNEESSIDKQYICKDGTIIWVRLTSTTISENEEYSKFHISIVQDITDIKKAEQVLMEENKRFQTTTNAIDSVIYVADLENHEILFVNKYVRELFGDIVGKKCYSAIQGKTMPCDFCTNHLLLDVNGNANQPYIWEFQNLITKRWYQCHDQAIHWTNGSLVRFEIATDITEKKENEQTLKKNEIKLRELNSTKDKLFSIIAHDLKNPFGVLLLASELLLKHLDKKDLTKVKSDVNIIYNASKRGYALLGNLLEWARSQTGNINFSPLYLHLKSTVSEFIEIVEYQAKNKNITITNNVPDDFHILADKNLLSIVFSNLLTNAIKFTYNNGSITIKAHTKGNMAEVSVIDTGIGIPKEDQDKLFRLDASFSRAGTSNEASTGLGLILCKEFIEKHNGKIWVESEVDKGSSFRFTLPYMPDTMPG